MKSVDSASQGTEPRRGELGKWNIISIGVKWKIITEMQRSSKAVNKSAILAQFWNPK